MMQEILSYSGVIGNFITAIATAVIAIFTFILAKENRQLRKAGTEPAVVAYLMPHADGNGAINFVLANIGQGAAVNVRFEFIYDNKDFEEHEVMLLNDSERSQLSILPQGEKLSILFGISFVLASSSMLKPFKVNICYENLTGRPFAFTQILDISQFKDFKGLLAKSTSYKIADSLEKIENHIKTLTKRVDDSISIQDATSIDSKWREFISVTKRNMNADGL